MVVNPSKSAGGMTNNMSPRKQLNIIIPILLLSAVICLALGLNLAQQQGSTDVISNNTYKYIIISGIVLLASTIIAAFFLYLPPEDPKNQKT